MNIKKYIQYLAVAVVVCVGMAGMAANARPAAKARVTTSHPDFERIKIETLNPESRYYYPTLLKSFLSNDTTMTDEDYHYFYYGTVFQEDYNPYRPNPFQAELKATEPLYFKHGTHSRSEKRQIRSLAEKMLADNPLHLTQLMYLVYSYEQEGKFNHAKIWKHKLDHLLLTISRSGTGADPEHAFVVVYPAHEFDFFNLSGVTVEGQSFQEPYYEKMTVRAPGQSENRDYWFNLHHLLEQYYLKHPSELKN